MGLQFDQNNSHNESVLLAKQINKNRMMLYVKTLEKRTIMKVNEVLRINCMGAGIHLIFFRFFQVFLR